jgi:hypothetical protein
MEKPGTFAVIESQSLLEVTFDRSPKMMGYEALAAAEAANFSTIGH